MCIRRRKHAYPEACPSRHASRLSFAASTAALGSPGPGAALAASSPLRALPAGPGPVRPVLLVPLRRDLARAGDGHPGVRPTGAWTCGCIASRGCSCRARTQPGGGGSRGGEWRGGGHLAVGARRCSRSAKARSSDGRRSISRDSASASCKCAGDAGSSGRSSASCNRHSATSGRKRLLRHLEGLLRIPRPPGRATGPRRG
jgi:hypothetical protein